MECGTLASTLCEVVPGRWYSQRYAEDMGQALGHLLAVPPSRRQTKKSWIEIAQNRSNASREESGSFISAAYFSLARSRRCGYRRQRNGISFQHGRSSGTIAGFNSGDDVS